MKINKDGLIVRSHVGTTWAVILRYGFHETLIAIRSTKAEAADYKRIYESVMREPFNGIVRDTDA